VKAPVVIRPILAALLAVSAVSAVAQTWVEVGSDQEVIHYVDAAGLARAGDVVRVSKRAVYRSPQPIGETPGLPLIAESLGVVEDDCKMEQHRVVSIALLGVDGTTIWSSGEMRRVWERIEPDSPGMATLAFACAQTRSR